MLIALALFSSDFCLFTLLYVKEHHWKICHMLAEAFKHLTLWSHGLETLELSHFFTDIISILLAVPRPNLLIGFIWCLYACGLHRQRIEFDSWGCLLYNRLLQIVCCFSFLLLSAHFLLDIIANNIYLFFGKIRVKREKISTAQHQPCQPKCCSWLLTFGFLPKCPSPSKLSD